MSSPQPANQTFNTPLSGIAGVTVFAIVVLLSLAVAFFFCSEVLTLSDNLKSSILHIYVFTIVIGWFSFTVSEDTAEFLLLELAVGGCCIVLIGMIEMFHPAFFWVGLGLLLIFSLTVVFRRVESTDTWDQIFIGIYTTWIVTGIVCSLGSPRLLNYAQPGLAFSTFHSFLDIRYLITACLTVILVGKSVADAFHEGAPVIPVLPSFAISGFADKNDSFFMLIIWPLAIVINAALFVVQKITNAIWQVIATVGAYLIRIGVNLAKYVVDILLNRGIWISILKILFSFGVLIIIVRLTHYLVPNVNAYLLKEWWPYEITFTNIRELLLFAGSVLFVLILINSLARIWELVDIPLPRSALAAAMLIVAWALSGLICFLVARLEFVKLQGFHSIGLYTLLLLLFISSVFLFQLCYHFISKARDGVAPQPRMSTWAIGSIAIFLIVSFATYWWVSRTAKVQAVETIELTEQQQREEARKSREQRRADILATAGNEGKNFWQTARLINKTNLVIIVRATTTSGKTWRSITLAPDVVIELSAINSDITVMWDTDPSANESNKQYNLAVEAYLDHKPTPEEEQKAPLNYFWLESASAIGLFCDD